MFEEGLNLDLIHESLYQFRADLGQRDLFDCSNELSAIMLSTIDIAKSTLSQYLP